MSEAFDVPAVPAVNDGPVTVAEAVAGVQGKIDALVVVEVAAFRRRIDAVVAATAFLAPASNEEEAEALSDHLKAAARLRKDIEDTRLGLTRRLDALKARIKAPFDQAGAPVAAAETAFRDALTPFLVEKKRREDEEAARVREIQRQAEERARLEREEAERKERAAREERERLEREAEAAKSKKAKAEAEEKLAAARRAEAAAADEAATASSVEAVVAAAPPVEVEASRVRSASGSGVGLVTTWEFEITDEAKVPREFLVVDQAAVRRAVGAGAREIAGVRIFEKHSTRRSGS